MAGERTPELGRSVIRDPAVAIAAAKCWLAGRGGGLLPVDSFHPTECTFCDFDRDGIIEAVTEFAAWAGISTDEETPLRAEIEAFLTISLEAQTRQVDRARGYQ